MLNKSYGNFALEFYIEHVSKRSRIMKLNKEIFPLLVIAKVICFLLFEQVQWKENLSLSRA